MSSPADLLSVEDCILQGIEVTDTIAGSLVLEVVTPFKGITLTNGFNRGDEQDDLPVTNRCQDVVVHRGKGVGVRPLYLGYSVMDNPSR